MSIPLTFAQATKEDLPGCIALGNSLFGECHILPLEKQVLWLEKNPDVTYVLKKDGQLLGYVSLPPVTWESVKRIFQVEWEEEFPKEVVSGDIERFEPGKVVHLYVMAMGVQPKNSQAEKRYYGFCLLTGIKKILIDFGKRGWAIETITAKSSSIDGLRLLRHLGFTETASPFPQTSNFVLRVNESHLPALLEYQQALHQSGKRRS